MLWAPNARAMAALLRNDTNFSSSRTKFQRQLATKKRANRLLIAHRHIQAVNHGFCTGSGRLFSWCNRHCDVFIDFHGFEPLNLDINFVFSQQALYNMCRLFSWKQGKIFGQLLCIKIKLIY